MSRYALFQECKIISISEYPKKKKITTLTTNGGKHTITSMHSEKAVDNISHILLIRVFTEE